MQKAFSAVAPEGYHHFLHKLSYAEAQTRAIAHDGQLAGGLPNAVIWHMGLEAAAQILLENPDISVLRLPLAPMGARLPRDSVMNIKPILDQHPMAHHYSQYIRFVQLPRPIEDEALYGMAGQVADDYGVLRVDYDSPWLSTRRIFEALKSTHAFLQTEALSDQERYETQVSCKALACFLANRFNHPQAHVYALFMSTEQLIHLTEPLIDRIDADEMALDALVRSNHGFNLRYPEVQSPQPQSSPR